MRQPDREAQVTRPTVTIDVLWTFALSAYARPGVEAACLAAQDRHDADINLMFALLWADRAGLALDDAGWCRLLAMSRHWQENILKPLRAARRAAKGSPGYQDLKARELAAEKKAMAALCENLAAAAAGHDDLLQRYADRLGIPSSLLKPIRNA